MSQRRAFFWFYIAPSALAGAVWGVASLPPFVLALLVIVLAAVRFHTVRSAAIYGPIRWFALAVIGVGILTVGGLAALLPFAAFQMSRWATPAGG